MALALLPCGAIINQVVVSCVKFIHLPALLEDKDEDVWIVWRLVWEKKN